MSARFRGESEHVLDGKGRMILPRGHREELTKTGKLSLMLSPWKTHLRAYPMDAWEAMEERLMANLHNTRVKRFVRSCVGKAVECPVDKQGRILIPAKLRGGVGIGSEVVLTGMLRWLEIWDKNVIDALDEAESPEDFEELENATMAVIGAF